MRFEGKTACAFTGHRPDGLPAGGDERAPEMLAFKLNLFHAVEEAARDGVRVFYAGGADGFDLLASEAVLALAPQYPGTELRLALPSRTQAARWLPARRARYARVLHAAASVWYASEARNAADTLMCRNRYMVERADCCICYLVKPRGGTLYTVDYALARGLSVLNLAMPGAPCYTSQ